MRKNEREHFRYGIKEYDELRRKLRKAMTPAEAKLWDSLRGRRFCGLKFRRQHGISNWIVDFYHGKSRTVIELDGCVHEEEDVRANDKARQEWLESSGYSVLRFTNEQALTDTARVLETIFQHIQNSPLTRGDAPGEEAGKDP